MKRLRRKSCWNPGQRSWRSRQRESSPGSWDRHVGRVSHRCSRSAQRRTPHGCRQQSGLGKKRMISINWLELLVGNLIVLASLRLFARPVPYGATPLCMKLSQPRITKICFSFKLTTIVAMADQIQPFEARTARLIWEFASWLLDACLGSKSVDRGILVIGSCMDTVSNHTCWWWFTSWFGQELQGQKKWIKKIKLTFHCCWLVNSIWVVVVVAWKLWQGGVCV